VPLSAALRFWLRLGFISFGGPAGQIALMHRELVQERRWISERRFLHALNYCMVLPGPEAQQLATYLGWLMHRTWGGVAAGVLFVLPSLFILIVLSALYMSFGHTPLVAGLFDGVRSAVVAVVLHAVWRMGGKTLGDPRRQPWSWALALGSFVALALLALPFPAVMLAAGLLGWGAARFGLDAFGSVHVAAPLAKASDLGSNAAAAVAPVIDDHTPTPAHARFSRRRMALVMMAAAALWLLPMAALLAWEGVQGTLSQMAWFFTKAALLTFGGAYAVLPYVVQGAVEQQQWLSTAQMIDGLALGESTPGPLIMVVAFVGFVGGWAREVAGPGLPFWGGVLAACVVTWFTFLPSFVFILAGGPLVESTHGRLAFTAPLAAIGCAVVGVIASLAVFFLAHVGWPQGWQAPPDLWALALSAVALVLLVGPRWGVLPVMGVGALLGLVGQWAGL
jgi:chromate transporter